MVFVVISVCGRVEGVVEAIEVLRVRDVEAVMKIRGEESVVVFSLWRGRWVREYRLYMGVW